MNYLNEAYYTSEEISKTLDSLTDENYGTLMAMATNRWNNNKLRGNRDGGPEDLLYEAIVLTLNLKRKWKRDVAMRTHFWQLLRNIAGEWAKDGLQASKFSIDFQSRQDTLEEQSQTSSPEFEETFENSAFEYAKRKLKNDKIAYNVLESKVKGLSRKQIMECYHISTTEYETILKRIQRKLRKGEDEQL